MTVVQSEGRSFLFVAPSFSLKQQKKHHKKKSQRGKLFPARSCLLRISIGAEGQLTAEVLSGFREWLVARAPELGKSPRYLPDDGGLNIEGLAWSPIEQALLFGVRTPVIDHKPLILQVRLKRTDGPWDLSNFELLSPIALATKTDREEVGIRSLEFDRSRGLVLIVVGNPTSESKAPFALYSWDGNQEGRVQHFPGVQFHKRMKGEGVTHGLVANRGAMVFVDDAGGYQLLWVVTIRGSSDRGRDNASSPCRSHPRRTPFHAGHVFPSGCSGGRLAAAARGRVEVAAFESTPVFIEPSRKQL